MPIEINSYYLAKMHYAHATSIPYEMLDTFLGATPASDIQAIASKLTSGLRGGGCSQMNGLFAAALEQFGFMIQRTFAAVNRSEPSCRLYTHMVLIAHIGHHKWLCDVGYGYRGFLQPLRLSHNFETTQGVHTYRVLQQTERDWSIQYWGNNDWTTLYHLRDETHHPWKFVAAQFFNTYSPTSPFSAKIICSKPTPQGGHHLVNNRLITIYNDLRTRTTLTSASDLVSILRERFDITLTERCFRTLPRQLPTSAKKIGFQK